MEELIRNHTINFYVGKINFDADGVAKVICKQPSEAVLNFECTPYQVKTIETKSISDVAIVYCVPTTKWLASWLSSWLCSYIKVAVKRLQAP